MFCEKCESSLGADSAFCEQCGTKTSKPQVLKPSPNVMQDDNGTLRWMYEFSMWKNPTILITCWKAFMLVCGLLGIFMFFLTLSDGLGFMNAINVALSVFAVVAGILTALLALAYPAVSLIYGGKYYVLFEMDEKGVNHIQLKSQFKKAQAWGFLTALLGAAAGNLAVAGAGLMGATKQSHYSKFSNVKSVTIKEKRNVIYVNEAIVRNQVYAASEDFAFIRDFILEHCPKNVKISY